METGKRDGDVEQADSTPCVVVKNQEEYLGPP